MFGFFKAELAELSQMEQAGQLTLWFGDQTAFHQNPHPVRAWQHPDLPLALPAQRGNLMGVLGFVRKSNEGVFYEFDGAMDSRPFIHLTRDFIDQLPMKDKHVIVIDKASAHYNKDFLARSRQWRKRNVFIRFLPSYSAELNVIEQVWRHCKHFWISVKAWLNKEELKQSVRRILADFRKTYRIDFKV
jgi:transposase